MPEENRQSVSGSGHTFTQDGDVYITHNYPPEKTSPSPPLSNKFDLSHLPTTGSALFGRDDELALLDQAWQDEGTKVLVLTAMGGAGKTALMQRWIDEQRYRGAAAAYAWSFYLQGAGGDTQASAAEFFDRALAWFGHDGSVIRSEHDKGVRLAELVCRQRTLLVLDGLEPLQYPMGGAMNGALKDKGLVSLCKQLAAHGNGLLLISSRQPVLELDGLTRARRHELKPLTEEAGVALFRAAGIIGTDKELADTVTAYSGHALFLSLLAKYLREYKNSDIRQQDTLRCLPDFPEETAESRHAFRVMATHERQLSGRVELQILFCLGLFDRPVAASVMSLLRKEGILNLSNDEWVFQAACERLRKQGLLNTARPKQPQTLDCHPLVRQYFGKRLAELHPESWRQAHLRLYEHFKAAAKPLPDTLEEMEPLFAAVRHGCAAGMHQKALDEVYWPRIQRSGDNYLCSKLGAFAADLAVVANFFTETWCTPAAGLTNADKAVVLSWAAFRLRALGRLIEAAEPMQASMDMLKQQEDWQNAASAASNLSELRLTIGQIAQAIVAGQQSGDIFWRMTSYATLTDAFHHAGELAESHALFVEAEKMQQKYQPEYDRLYSFPGFQYCDVLLDGGRWLKVCDRAKKTLKWAREYLGLLPIALDKLSLGRAALQEALAQAGLPVVSDLAPDLACVQPIRRYVEPIRREAERISGYDEPIRRAVEPICGAVQPVSGAVEAIQRAVEWLNQAVDGLREAGQEQYLPLGLLARAAWGRWAGVLLAQPAHWAKAEKDLRECEDIALRGGMLLHLIDCHLEAARLALASGQPVLARTAAAHVAAAEDGITKTGYKRRLAEVQLSFRAQREISHKAKRGDSSLCSE